MKTLTLSTLALLSIATPSMAVTVTGNSDATSLVSALLGANSGITVVGTPTLTGSSLASGTFTGGNDAASRLGVDSGIVLSSGKVTDIATVQYTNNASGTEFFTPGDNQLNQLIPDLVTVDAMALEFNFTSNTDSLYFLNYVFASQEYPGYVGSQFNDPFAFFIDGVNVATVPGTNTPVSVNSINNGGNGLPIGGVNPNYYISNANNSQTNVYNNTRALEFGGLTVPLTASVANLSPGVHSFKLVIADAEDAMLDSAVFLSGNGISSTPIYGGGGVPPAATSVPEPLTVFGTLVGGGAILKLRRRFKAQNKL